MNKDAFQKTNLSQEEWGEIEPFLQRLTEKIPNVETIVLFGSCVSKRAKGSNDIDLLVLKRNTTPRIDVFHEIVDNKILEITVEDSHKFEEELKIGHPFALNVLRHGVLIYDKGFWKKVLKYRNKPPLEKFTQICLNQAKDRLEENQLESAAIYAFNALLLSKNDVNLSYKLKSLSERVGIEKFDRKTIKEIIERVGALIE